MHCSNRKVFLLAENVSIVSCFPDNSKISIASLPLKTPKGKKRVAFRTETGSYLSVDPQGQLTCNSVTLEENAIFDLVRPIETGDFAKFTNCRKLLLQAISWFATIMVCIWRTSGTPNMHNWKGGPGVLSVSDTITCTGDSMANIWEMNLEHIWRERQ